MTASGERIVEPLWSRGLINLHKESLFLDEQVNYWKISKYVIYDYEEQNTESEGTKFYSRQSGTHVLCISISTSDNFF